MKRILLRTIPIVVLAVMILGACGNSKKDTSPVQPTKAVITLSTAITSSLPADTIITGYDLTFTLPEGVTIKSSSPPVADAAVVVASGMAAGSSITGVYSATTGSTPGTLRILVASANGFNAGSFSTVTCDIAPGTFPVRSDFDQPLSFSASGYNTTTDTTVSLVSYLSLTATVKIQ
jgi:hypothetical protein